jgi:uncharacterized protein
MINIADSGLLVAALGRRDRHHDWAASAFCRESPFLVCDAVLVEAAGFFPNPVGILRMLERGDLILDPLFVFADQVAPVLALTEKYADLPMDLADACVVRMSEIHDRCKVWTVDRSDFLTYRRHGRSTIPCEFPPER